MWYEKTKAKMKLIADVFKEGSEKFNVHGKNYKSRTRETNFFTKLRDKIHTAIEIIKTDTKSINFEAFGYKHPDKKQDFSSGAYYASRAVLNDQTSQKEFEKEMKQKKVPQDVFETEMKEFDKRKQDLKEELIVHKEKLNAFEKGSAKYDDYLNKIQDIKGKIEKIDKAHQNIKEKTKQRKQGVYDLEEYRKRKEDMKHQIQDYKEKASAYEKDSPKREEYLNKINKAQEQLKKIDEIHKKTTKQLTDIAYFAKHLVEKNEKKQMEVAKQAQKELQGKGKTPIEIAKELKAEKDTINVKQNSKQKEFSM